MRHFVVASMREEGRCWISKVIGGKHSTSEPSHRCHENAFVNSLATVEGRWITAISRAWIFASSLTSGVQNSPQSAFILNFFYALVTTVPASIYQYFLVVFWTSLRLLLSLPLAQKHWYWMGVLKGANIVVFKCPVLSYLSNRPHRVDSRKGWWSVGERIGLGRQVVWIEFA